MQDPFKDAPPPESLRPQSKPKVPKSFGEYSYLYENGPVEVKLLLAGTATGAEYRANVQLRGVLSGETEKNLVFDSIRLLNCGPMYVIGGGKSLVKKDLVAVIYQVERSDDDSA